MRGIDDGAGARRPPLDAVQERSLRAELAELNESEQAGSAELKEELGDNEREERRIDAIERKRLKSSRLDEASIKDIQKLRKALFAQSGDDKAAFERLVYAQLEDPEMTEGLTQSEIHDGVEYLWNGVVPRSMNPFLPGDVIQANLRANYTPAGWRDWLKKRGTDKALDAIEKRLPWYLKLPYRMIKKRVGDLLGDAGKPGADKKLKKDGTE